MADDFSKSYDYVNGGAVVEEELYEGPELPNVADKDDRETQTKTLESKRSSQLKKWKITVAILALGMLFVLGISTTALVLGSFRESQLRSTISKMEAFVNSSLATIEADLKLSRAAIEKDLKAQVNESNDSLFELIQNLAASVEIRHLPEEPIDCPSTYYRNPHSNTCLRLIKENMNWDAAKAYCESSGEYLATFASLESASWVQQMKVIYAAWQYDWWIGLRRTSTNFVWKWYGLNTEPVNYYLWKSGEPNNNGGNQQCVSFDAKVWNDFSCNEGRYFICEK